jgi:hypothetical protein
MPSAALVVFDEARLLLNDTAAKLYTDAKLLPCLQKAYRELQQNLKDNGVSSAREQDVPLTITAGLTVLDYTSGPPDLPANLLYPIMLHEKYVGDADINYIRMQETTWTPDASPETRLLYWSWRNSTLQFVGATGDIEIRIRYWGGLAPIVDNTTIIPIEDSETFLAARTAAIAAATIGAMPTKADLLQEDAVQALNILLSTAVKNRQSLPVRRRPFRSFRFGGRSGIFRG